MVQGQPASKTKTRQPGPDRLQQLWRTEKLPPSTVAALSGDGKVLLTCSGQTLLLWSTESGKAIGDSWVPSWGFTESGDHHLGVPRYVNKEQQQQHSDDPGAVESPLLALDYLGETAVIVFIQKLDKDGIYDVALKVYQFDKYPILVKSRNIKSVSSPRSLSVSPFGGFVAFVYNPRNGPEQIEIIDSELNTGGHHGDGHFLVRGRQEPLNQSEDTLVDCDSLSVCFTQDYAMVAVSNTGGISLHSIPLFSLTRNIREVAFDEGYRLSIIDLYRLANRIHFIVISKIFQRGLRPIELKFLLDRHELVMVNELCIAVYSTSLLTWATHSFSAAPPLDHWALAVIRERLIVSGNGLLRILHSQDLSSCRELKLRCSSHPHWLTTDQDSLIIIAWKNETFTCYAIPFYLEQSTARKGPVPDLSGTVLFTSERVGGGGYGDVFKGLWNIYSIEEPPPIAIKVLRVPSAAPHPNLTKVCGHFKFAVGYLLRKYHLKRYAREIEVWRRLEHKHIVPFVGTISSETTPIPALISEWMPNGEFVRNQ
jgi:hypothetical protein